MIPHEYFQKVKKYFQGNDTKTWEWFTQLHPNFGMLTPMNMIKLGREQKVMDFINQHMNQ